MALTLDQGDSAKRPTPHATGAGRHRSNGLHTLDALTITVDLPMRLLNGVTVFSVSPRATSRACIGTANEYSNCHMRFVA